MNIFYTTQINGFVFFATAYFNDLYLVVWQETINLGAVVILYFLYIRIIHTSQTKHKKLKEHTYLLKFLSRFPVDRYKFLIWQFELYVEVAKKISGTACLCVPSTHFDCICACLCVCLGGLQTLQIWRKIEIAYICAHVCTYDICRWMYVSIVHIYVCKTMPGVYHENI